MYIYPPSRKVAVHCALDVCSPDELCDCACETVYDINLEVTFHTSLRS